MAGKVFLQVDGIPMGHNAAVNLANFYLFCYELNFLRQLVTYITNDSSKGRRNYSSAHQEKRARAVDYIVSLSTSKRYIDDILGINSNILFDPALAGWTAAIEDAHGFKGIYPPTVALEVAGSGYSINYLDVTISHSSPTALDTITLTERPIGNLVCCLYVKTRHPPFDTINVHMYPDVDSDLIASSKYGIIISQFHRYKRIITVFENFVAEMALLLHNLVKVKGYREEKLLRTMATCCCSAGNLYGQLSGYNVSRIINDTYQQLCADAHRQFCHPANVNTTMAYAALKQRYPEQAAPHRVMLPR